VRKVTGTVVEDRGPVGAGGRRLYVVAVPNDPEDPDFHVRSEDELEQDTSPVRPLSSEEVQQFLETGGLISILRRNMAGGMNQPSVWLCRDSLGNVTFTFDEERGLAGGRRVPFFALHGEKVFTPKVEEVVEYITSLGLSEELARAIVANVGTTPR
jgi:hypothetical protein